MPPENVNYVGFYAGEPLQQFSRLFLPLSEIGALSSFRKIAQKAAKRESLICCHPISL